MYHRATAAAPPCEELPAKPVVDVDDIGLEREILGAGVEVEIRHLVEDLLHAGAKMRTHLIVVDDVAGSLALRIGAVEHRRDQE